MARTELRASGLDFRFAFRFRWLALHVLALAALATMTAAGFWQISRLQEKQARNRLLDERTAQPVVDVGDLLRATDAADAVDAVEYRIVEVTGRYAPEDQVFVRNRTFDGAPGAWVLTPLVRDDGTAIIVNRGWIPSSNTVPTLPAGAEAPAGEVTVEGMLLPGQRRGSFGATDTEGRRLETLARADLERLQEQVAEELFPAYVQVLPAATDPVLRPLPRPVPQPDRTEGPHRGYAGQWFLFATIWVIGYPLLLRRSAQRRADGPDAPTPPEGADDAAPPDGADDAARGRHATFTGSLPNL